MSGSRSGGYYEPVHSATQQGARPDGRGRVREVPEEAVRNYYGRAVLKEPVWSWEIPWYFFAGGLAGASADLALVARLAGNDKLARRALLAALGAVVVSPVLLISDLGRPERFYNMLRVVKPTSPMSVGTWVLSAFGTATGIAATSEVLGVFPRLGRACEVVSALLGPALATYTAVLITDTSVPVWHEARRELPLVFAASSAASAGAAAAILTPVGEAGPARRLAAGGALAEIGASALMKRRLGGFLAEPYEKEEAGRFDKLSKVFSVAGAVLTAFAGRRRRPAAVAGGALVLAGATLERWSVFR
ncbi:MAG TPA: NrfD/PsrC family molybdoenzyme membrane anchor subunit, partial [Rubrobacter sp.]|nr:NrfD/PsrC family molybdoenzyme membrane anchor subunit [Rubrobacter sp.]